MVESREPAAVEAYLHRHIPVSRAMAVRVVACTAAHVRLQAPLAANVNHRATVFGGSASAVAILAAWTWLHYALQESGLRCRVVIQRNTIDYLAPIDGDFAGECDGLDPVALERLRRTLRRYGKARTTLEARLVLRGKTVARFSGAYVALLGS
ncbi:MAG: YiiD C-terminal domain-containing protein [Opitutales bacterium]